MIVPKCLLLGSNLENPGSNLVVRTSRSSRPEAFCKKGVLKNFTKLTGKHLRQSLFLKKVAGLRPATLLKKRLWHNTSF